MSDETGISEAVEEFKRQAAFAVGVGNRTALRRLFRQYVIAIRARHREEGIEVLLAMREALREVMLEPSSKVKRGWFDDL